MERKSKAEIKKALEALKAPKGPEDKGTTAAGKGKTGKMSQGAAGGKTYRPKI